MVVDGAQDTPRPGLLCGGSGDTAPKLSLEVMVCRWPGDLLGRGTGRAEMMACGGWAGQGSAAARGGTEGARPADSEAQNLGSGPQSCSSLCTPASLRLCSPGQGLCTA